MDSKMLKSNKSYSKPRRVQMILQLKLTTHDIKIYIAIMHKRGRIFILSRPIYKNKNIYLQYMETSGTDYQYRKRNKTGRYE